MATTRIDGSNSSYSAISEFIRSAMAADVPVWHVPATKDTPSELIVCTDAEAVPGNAVELGPLEISEILHPTH